MKVSKYIEKCYKRGYGAIIERELTGRSLVRNEDGSISGSAVSILVLLVTLMLCALLFGTLQGQTDTKIAALGDTAANTSYANIKSSGWGAIDLYSMIPYVAVFVVILGMLMGLTGRND